MVKIIGILMIMVSCSAIGISVSGSYRQRVSSIRSFINALQIVKAEIVFKNTPTHDVFVILTHKCSGAAQEYFECISKCIGENCKDHETVLKENQISLRINKLKSCEINEIENVLSVLGKYDICSQGEIIDRGILQLEEIYKSAEADQNKNGKLCSAFGITAGIVIAVLLL